MRLQHQSRWRMQSLMPRLSFGSALTTAAPKTQTVDELSDRIRLAITSVPELRNVAVRGELQSLKRHSSGHVYFTLVGKDSRISSVLFRSHAGSVLMWPQDGDEVLVVGSVEVYAKSGAYQLYASRMMPIGIGAQSRAREELSAALEREGLFDVRIKRLLPKYPTRVAVVTSPTGAALQDILKVSHTRSPYVDLILVPATVQGLEAPPQIARALALAGAVDGVSCVILARGGGAKDDLSPFDDEMVVRAVRACRVPVAVGVGHQTDSSLADRAADLSLPTPSAAAERVFPDSKEIHGHLSHSMSKLKTHINNAHLSNSIRLDRLRDRSNASIKSLFSESERVLDASAALLSHRVNTKIDRETAMISSIASILDNLSPLKVLSRGYSICRDSNGEVVRRAGDLHADQVITVQLHDGSIESVVKSISVRT